MDLASPRAADFRLLAAGQTLSWFGNGFQTVALAVGVVAGGGSATVLGAVLACEVGAMLAGTLFGGVWADRLQPQRVMVVSDTVRLATVTGMAVLFGLVGLSAPLLCVLAALTAFAGSFFTPAMTALKPMVVARDRLQSANATLGLLRTTASVAGPAAGGLVVAVWGPASGFGINAGSYLVSALSVLFIRARAERAPRTGLLGELREGWTEIRRRDWLLSGVLAATAYHVANGVVLVLIQVVAIKQLGGASAAGLIAGAEGLGGMLGAGVALRWRPLRALRAGWFALLLMPLWVLVYVWPALLGAVLVGAVIGYAGLMFFDVAWQTAMQDHVPHRVLARVASWDMLASFVGMPVGNALAGPLANALGIDRVLVGCAAVLFASGVAPLFVAGTRRLTRVPHEDAEMLDFLPDEPATTAGVRI